MWRAQNLMAGGTQPIPNRFLLLEFWPLAAPQEIFSARPDCGKRATRAHLARAAIVYSYFHWHRRGRAKRSPEAYTPRSHPASHSGPAASRAMTGLLRDQL